jgi:hypothetical protein
MIQLRRTEVHGTLQATTPPHYSRMLSDRSLAIATAIMLCVSTVFPVVAADIGLVGLSWRAWLLLYTLPAWYTALRTTG